MPRVIVVGWDGATWALLDRLVVAGKLPNLEILMKRSVHAPMRSAHPPVTAPAWVSMATGVNPGRHGCFDFNRPDGALSSLRPLQSWDIAEKTFYEVLAERGRRTILVNLPVTYPPLTGGITLTSLLTQGDNAVFPETLKQTHPALASYRCFPDTTLRARGRIGDYLKDIRAVERARFDCVRALWDEPWDVFFVVFSGTDWVSHEAFPDLAEGRYDAQPDALALFEEADRYLGWMAERLNPDDHLLMVSDHGFTTAKGNFYLNEWLEDRGVLAPDYQKPKAPPSHRMEEAAQRACQGKVSNLPAGVLRAVHRNAAALFAAKVFRKLGGTWPVSLGVDHGASRAFTLTAECLGVTVNEAGRYPEGCVPAAETRALVEDLRGQLAALRDPDGEPVFTAVEKRESVYHGPRTAEAADLLLGPGRWGVAAAIKALKNIPFIPHRVGIHDAQGIFLGHGPAFGRGRLGEGELSLLDVAPALFHLLGEPLPEGLDGRLAPGLFAPGFLEKNPPAYRPVTLPDRTRQDLDADAIQERLRGLGYMG